MPRPLIPRYVPSREGVADASVEAMAEAAAQAVAERIAEEARRLATEQKLPDLAASIRVVTKTRPKGRGQIMVVADHEDAAKLEFGDSATARYRILGQAAAAAGRPESRR